MSENERLTEKEEELIVRLGTIWDDYLRLPTQHPMHHLEFSHAIHRAQQLIMSRPVARQMGWTKESSNKTHARLCSNCKQLVPLDAHRCTNCGWYEIT